eukprot:135815_1
MIDGATGLPSNVFSKEWQIQNEMAWKKYSEERGITSYQPQKMYKIHARPKDDIEDEQKHLASQPENRICDPSKCIIYKSVMHNQQYNIQNLNHLNECTHFEDEYEEKPKCRYDQKCKAFLRLQNDGNRLDDRCHVKLYNHPPRNNRQLRMAENMHSFLINTNFEQNYKQTNFDTKKYKCDAENSYIKQLI